MSFIKFHSKFRPKKHNSTTYHFSLKQPIKYKTSDNRGKKCWEKCWKEDYFSQIGCSCKITSPLLPHSMLNEKFQPSTILYGGGGVWLKALTRCLQTLKLNICVFEIFSTRFVPDCIKKWRKQYKTPLLLYNSDVNNTKHLSCYIKVTLTIRNTSLAK